jgi:hypothetical protein
MKFPRGIKAKSVMEVNASRRRAARAACALATLALSQAFEIPFPFARAARAEDELPTVPLSGAADPSVEAAPVPSTDTATLPATEPETAPAAPDAPPSSPTTGTDTNASEIPPTDGPLPEIEARNFAVKVVKRSTSGKTYLFDDLTNAQTRLGKLLLLRREPDPTTVPAMAFRVVKLYPESNRFAAKRVRRYGTTRALEAGLSYTALEKVGDVLITPPTAQDKADLAELETGALPDTAPIPEELPPGTPSEIVPGAPIPPVGDPTAEIPGDSGETSAAEAPATPPESPATPPEAAAYDPALDAGTSLPSSSAASQDDEEDEEGLGHRFGASVEEVTYIDHNRQWLSAGAGYFNAGTIDDATRYFKAAGVRYGYTVSRMVLLKRSQLQDSIALEAGVFAARLLTFPEGQNGTYTVVPLIGTARYNFHIGENFGVFLYAGLRQNLVPQAVNVAEGSAEEDTLNALQTTAPAAGGGFFFRVGPGWYARVDLGYDSLTLGLTLRF